MIVKRLNTWTTILVLALVLIGIGPQSSYAKPIRPSSKRTALKRSAPQEELRRLELRTAPLALLASWYTLDASYRFTEHFALGPAVVFYNSRAEHGNMLAPTYKGTAYGLHANYYFRSVEVSGFYTGLHAYQEDYRSYPHGLSGHEDRNGYRVNLTAGYQARMNRVSLLMGLGVEVRSHKVVETRTYDSAPKEYSETHRIPTVEIKLGFEI